MNIPKGKFSKIILISEDLFLNSEFSLRFMFLDLKLLVVGVCHLLVYCLPVWGWIEASQ